MIIRHQAIYNTHPQVVSIREGVAYDANDKPVKLDKAAVTVEEKRLAEQVKKTAYQRERAAAYPPIGDQLDAIWKQLNAMRMSGQNLVVDADRVLGEVLAVKKRYPK